MAFGIRGDDEARQEWLDIAAEMHRVVASTRGRYTVMHPAFAGLVALHRGEIGNALTYAVGDPESYKPWHDAAWRPWYTAMWAEAGVLAALPDRRARLDRARFVVRENPVAAAIVERAAAIDADDTETLMTTAAALHAAGARHQHARTLVLAGGDARAEGRELMAGLGAAPMAEPT